MADEPNEPDAPADPPEEPKPDDEPFDPDRAKAKIAKANSEAKALRERLKAAEEKAQRLDALEDAQKSEAEKAAERLSAAEQRAAEAEGRALRSEVASEKGLTAAQAKRLVGSAREELEADADELLATFAPPAEEPPPPGRSRPREALRSGVAPAAKPAPTDPAELAALVPRT